MLNYVLKKCYFGYLKGRLLADIIERNAKNFRLWKMLRKKNLEFVPLSLCFGKGQFNFVLGTQVDW